ncbi:MAG: outer rane efflux protein [Mucilaginibacter sp.]|nr:outer rane efflux protein [Mucilaginibacter sp.]
MVISLVKKTSRKKTFFIVFAMIVNCSSVKAQTDLSLKEAIEQTLKNNLELRQVQVTEKTAVLELDRSKKNLLPEVSFSSSNNFNLGRTLDPTTNLYISQNDIYSTSGISSNVFLFQGFQKLSTIKRNKYLLEADTSSVAKIRDDLILKVITSYLSYLNYADQLTAAKQQLRYAQEQMVTEREKFDVGKKTESDLARANSQIAKAQLNMVVLENGMNEALLELKQLMNVHAEAAFKLTMPADSLLPAQIESGETIYNRALRFFPDIKKAEFNRLAALENISIARSNYYPTLSLAGTVASSYLYQFHYNPPLFSTQTTQVPYFKQLRLNSYEYTGINISVPIFTHISSSYAVKRAKLDYENAEIDKEIAQSNLYKIINQSIADLSASRQNFQLAERSYEYSKTTFAGIQKKYNRGASSSLDYIQAENDLNASQFNLINSKYDLIFKQKIVMFYSGLPLYE